MKKQLLLCMAAALTLAACRPATDNRLTLTGTVEREGVDTLYVEGDQNDSTYAAIAVSDGKYRWQGTADTVAILRVRFSERPQDVCHFITEPGNIVLDIPADGKGYPSGTPLNDSIMAYGKNGADLDTKAGALARHADDAFGVYLLRDFQFTNRPERIEEATKRLRERFPGNFWTEYVGGHVEGLMRGNPGRTYTDLRMPTPEGGELSLSDVVPANRYTYVDFWASWCGPCVGDIPHVKAAYERYHKKGLEIVGVSFDAKEESWKEALAKYGMTWPQMSDLKGWGCAAAKVYGINAIPSTLLIGQDGVIVARNLRGEELAEKMAELLGK